MFNINKNRKVKSDVSYSVRGRTNSEVRNSFNVWKSSKKKSSNDSLLPYLKYPEEFNAFIAGLKAFEENNGVLSELAFPPIVLGKPILQFRPYGENYNENKIYLGRTVSLANTQEELDCGSENFGDIYGEVTGIRKEHIDNLPVRNRTGIISYYDSQNINVRNKMIFMFWVTKITLGSWGDSDSEPPNDITDW